jgi:hypothetical protein
MSRRFPKFDTTEQSGRNALARHKYISVGRVNAGAPPSPHLPTKTRSRYVLTELPPIG